VGQKLYTLFIEWKGVSMCETQVFSSEEKRDDYVHALVNFVWPEEVGDRGPWEIMEAMEDEGAIEFDCDEVCLDPQPYSMDD
jgi:hypothetical protein